MDGTLLDHHTYSIEPARPMLAYLKHEQVPVIPTTSKTCAELLALREHYQLDGPFIVENGAAIYIPHGFFPHKPAGAVWSDGYWCKSLSSPRLHWLKIVDRLKKDFPNSFIGFNDMSVSEICEATGLPPADAELAAQRQYGEPVMFTGDSEQKSRFIQAAQHRGATVLEGGRFLHLCGDVNKGIALKWLTDTYTQQFALAQAPTTIALGDSGNDIAMLEQADIGIRILSPTRQPPVVNKTSGLLLTSSRYGPEGWNEMLDDYFKNMP
ncbi:HAD-IIB family hydrolase [Alteromonas sediminis]|uniref:HAD-IIB family hydrolase n=2 Tax=Alteromonas sediminis TaxID=2259342 RepID=A0A3N5Y1U7_9ALTE|nr:HAD-IIB family hydrolase [Alteromonas sediminis]